MICPSIICLIIILFHFTSSLPYSNYFLVIISLHLLYNIHQKKRSYIFITSFLYKILILFIILNRCFNWANFCTSTTRNTSIWINNKSFFTLSYFLCCLSSSSIFSLTASLITLISFTSYLLYV